MIWQTQSLSRIKNTVVISNPKSERSMKFKSIKYGALLTTLSTVAYLVGCSPEDFNDIHPITVDNLQASFTATPVEGKSNTWLLKTNTENVLSVLWDKGDGHAAVGATVDTLYLPDAGEYDVTLTTVGIGGAKATASQHVVVPTSDPVAGNLVVGGRMDDETVWTKLRIGDPSVAFNFVDGVLVASGGNWGHSGVYQAINVVAGRKYKLDMNVTGSGATDTWFEVYLGSLEPQQGVDYSDGGIRLGLNTWTGCGKTPFDTKLSKIACTGTGSIVQFDQSGTVYLLIKSGGANLGDTGITIDNVEFRGTK
jgi:hypothetical protein